MDAGAVLRQERERLGLTLDSISTATKITVPALRALESRELDLLPSGIYLRGFLRAYAQAVGLDPERVVLEYTAPPEPAPLLVAGRDQQQPAGHSHVEPARSGGVAGRHMAVGMLVIQIVIAVGALYVLIRERESNFAAARPAPSSGVSSTRSETGTSGTVDQHAAVDDVPRVMRVEIAATGPCWVEATVDGRPVIYRLMATGERHSITVENELQLRIGDPSTFIFRVDGSSGRPFGRPGVPATARLTRSNVHEFIAETPTR